MNIQVNNNLDRWWISLKNTLIDNCLEQFISETTTVHNSTLDVIISTENQTNISCIDIGDRFRASIHFPVIFCIKVYWKPTKKLEKIEFRKKLTNNEVIRSEILKSALVDRNNFHSASQASELYFHELSLIYNKVCPWITKMILPRNRPNKPWYNSSLRKLKKDVRIKEKLYRKTNKLHEKEDFMLSSKFYYNAIKEARLRYYNQNILRNNGNSKILYQTFRKLCGTKKSSPWEILGNDKNKPDEFRVFLTNKINMIYQSINMERKI